jgi:hypothetical protein
MGDDFLSQLVKYQMTFYTGNLARRDKVHSDMMNATRERIKQIQSSCRTGNPDIKSKMYMRLRRLWDSYRVYEIDGFVIEISNIHKKWTYAYRKLSDSSRPVDNRIKAIKELVDLYRMTNPSYYMTALGYLETMSELNNEMLHYHQLLHDALPIIGEYVTNNTSHIKGRILVLTDMLIKDNPEILHRGPELIRIERLVNDVHIAISDIANNIDIRDETLEQFVPLVNKYYDAIIAKRMVTQ